MISLDLELELEDLAQDIAFEKDTLWPRWSDVENYETSRGLLAQQIRAALMGVVDDRMREEFKEQEAKS